MIDRAWSIERRDGRYYVVRGGDGAPVPGGCHDSRVDAIKHQRALYANEARVAAMYAELDADYLDEVALLDDDAQLEAAALEVDREPVPAQITISPQIFVQPTPVTVEAPQVTVQPPSVEVNVEPPAVQVSPQIVLPADKREVVFERDPLGRISGAVIEEATTPPVT